ncbi:MAG: pyrroline-5-carboxylate reductase [Acidobacteriota bacterium]
MRKRGGRIAVIGAGKIGETLIRALIESGVASTSRMIATARSRERLDFLKRDLGIRVSRKNSEAVAGSDIILICVKPQVLAEVLEDIRDSLAPGKVVISVVASVSTASIETALGQKIPVIRTMPNTPCLLRTGMTGICGGRYAKEEHLALAERIFRSIGLCVRLEERHMDAVTGLSASGPAFVYIIIESLAEGGVKVGLPREVATQLAAQTVLGAARMVLDTREHPAKLKDSVTTPAGCTMDGILELEEGGLRVTLIKAVVRATERARELAND